jgi:hypothetical protein
MVGTKAYSIILGKLFIRKNCRKREGGNRTKKRKREFTSSFMSDLLFLYYSIITIPFPCFLIKNRLKKLNITFSTTLESKASCPIASAF